MRASQLFDLSKSIPFAFFFLQEDFPWKWVSVIQGALASIQAYKMPREIPPHFSIEGPVWIDPTVQLPPYGVIQGPAWIGAHTEIRAGAFLRGGVIVGEHVVIGSSCELKHCLLMDRVQIGHFNYVGDSILGEGAHLGAGAVLANLRLDQKEVFVKGEKGLRIPSGLRKLGAMLGEGAEVGCNGVLQPGTILGRKAAVGPAISFGGYLEPGKLALSSEKVIIKSRECTGRKA